MSKRGITITIIIAVVLLAAAAFLLTRNMNPVVDRTQSNSITPETATSPSANDESAASDVTIVYTNNGFAKPTLMISAGDTVRVQNDSNNILDFASDDHPTHTKQSALNIGEIAPGENKTFVMDATGTWGYHNHENDAHTGTLIVK